MKVFYFNSGNSWINCTAEWQRFILDIYSQYNQLVLGKSTPQWLQNMKDKEDWDNFLSHHLKIYGISKDSHHGIWFDSEADKTAFLLRWTFTVS